MTRIYSLALCFWSIIAFAGDESRIVTAGASVTEIVCALGGMNRLVGVDSSSLYPQVTANLPKIGYSRMLSAEGILSLRPELLVCNEDAGPPRVLEQIEKAGVRVLRIPSSHNVEGAISRVERIGEILNAQGEAAKLVEHITREIEEAEQFVRQKKEKPSVLFIYARAGGTLNASGVKTAAHAMIELAGGRNAITGYEGYKPLTAESALAAAPDSILVTSRGLQDLGGIDGLLKASGLALTPAGKNRRVIEMDDLLLLSFGPRIGQAIRELAEKLHVPIYQPSVDAAQKAL